MKFLANILTSLRNWFNLTIRTRLPFLRCSYGLDTESACLNRALFLAPNLWLWCSRHVPRDSNYAVHRSINRLPRPSNIICKVLGCSPHLADPYRYHVTCSRCKLDLGTI